MQMVYQSLFDVFLFNELFSDLQLWGIGITVVTFAMDIYITIKDNNNAQQIEAKKGAENTAENTS